MAEDLAWRLEGLVMERGWPEGRILGSETALIERFGVSRAVFREAVRIVEHHGAARMRRGPKGGLVVTAPDPRAVQRPATLYLDYANATTEDLFAARGPLELTCVGLVADNLDESGANRLRSTVAGESEPTMHDLHVLIARLTGNPALLLLVKTLSAITDERTRTVPFQPTEFAGLHDAHETIVEALIAGDGALAQHRMRLHLAESLDFYAARGH